jgi:protein ImuB
VLAITAAGGPRIAALNEAAEAAGLMVGEPLADARAKASNVQTRAIDTAADDAALRRLALWATRYTPTASPWGEENGADGFFLDIEGAAHLFGGEEKLLADLAFRLERNFGLPARLAVADTPGTAWALSRFHSAPSPILPSGQEATALAPLPVEALRLSPETCRTLRRLGFKSVGMMLDKPRAPFAARFPAELLRRIDQALGRADEPLIPIVAPPVYHTLRYLLEPIITQEAIVALANRLMHILVHVLTRDDVGARALRLSLYRVDGAVETIDIGLTLPSRNVAHIARLIDLKLEALAATEDAGFGFEAVGLAVTRAETIPALQNELIAEDAGNADRAERCAALVDTLRQRLGPQSVQRFEAIASHLPERAEALLPATAEMFQSAPPKRGRSTATGRRVGVNNGTDLTPPRLASLADPPLSGEGKDRDSPAPAWPDQKTRPLLLLPRAEPTEVTALVPDGPPRRFRWRGVIYEVATSEGPERIGAEWWRRHDGHRSPGPTRDYYLVEDAAGHLFWLYREGLYERETAAARWFVQGLSA